ncbi:hypothetical protein OH76DRAFT_581695 [Lentinus brumalis]|uniref:Uncharacterized protein n=1 Tax=Lentinus brumalis TaxID=2498619 RepID=A0A371DTV7_9APHY|nr:hypothetical protein OH76DRAFT_581695 [Polyporus brumalis]
MPLVLLLRRLRLRHQRSCQALPRLQQSSQVLLRHQHLPRARPLSAQPPPPARRQPPQVVLHRSLDSAAALAGQEPPPVLLGQHAPNRTITTSNVFRRS